MLHIRPDVPQFLPALVGAQHPTAHAGPVYTPLDVDAWEMALRSHPDRAYAKYIVNGLRQGFRIGFQHRSPLTSAKSNKRSSQLHPGVISKYIADELARGRMLGPFPHSLRPAVHLNRVGLVPKGHNTGKYRMITDLSHPSGKKCQRRGRPGIVLTVVPISRRRSQSGSFPRQGCTAGESQHRVGIPPCTRPPTGSMPAGYGMGG